ncbi:MAG: elongation factor G [candidate division WOR-3 bacterium]|nr:elongation factor G [candidate division WOR-3 bacterium]
MWQYDIRKIRNLGFFGHGGCGKTSICDVIMYLLKQNTRIGRVDNGTSLFDYDEEEISRKISINLALGYGVYKEHFFNIVDMPGYLDFIGEVYAGVRAIDSGIIVVDSSSGVEVGTELAYKILSDNKKPIIFFINKLKKEHTDFYKTLDELKKNFSSKIFPLFLPIGKEVNFSGLYDLLENKVYLYENEEIKISDNIPEELNRIKDEYYEKIIEACADVDEEIMNDYLEGKEISKERLKKAIKKGILNCEISPVLLGDGLNNIGINLILDFAINFLPSPIDNPKIKVVDVNTNEEKDFEINEKEPLAFVFKTLSDPHIGDLNIVRVYSGAIETGMNLLNTFTLREEKINQIYYLKGKERQETNKLRAGEIGALVKLKETKTNHTLTSPLNPMKIKPIEFPPPSISVAIVPKTKGDEERISNGLHRLSDEDPTFTFHYDYELKQQLINGLGELHLDVIISRLKRRFNVSIDLEKPKVPYRETIRKTASAMGKYVKQSGGRGQYGICYIKVEPLERGKGYEFVNQIFGGAIPASYIPAVETGIKKAMEEGVLAGYKVVDVKVTLYDGKYHPVDSSNLAFEIAGSLAFKEAQKQGDPYLLEPIYNVEVVCPEASMGEVIGDLNARRGRILGIEAEGKMQKIKALVPYAELYKYSSTLRSITQGRGYFTMKFSHYEEVPKELALKIIEETKKEKEKENKKE